MSKRLVLQRLTAGPLGVLVAASCASPPTQPAPADVVIAGRVEFPAATRAASYRIAASINDIAVGATVSLIDPVTQYTVGSILTNSQGSFVMKLAAGLLVTDKYYTLEAVKGLGSNAVGHDAARVRTLICNAASGWTGLNTSGAQKLVIINESSTALSMLATYRGLDSDATQMAKLMSKLLVGVSRQGWPDDLNENDTPITFSEMVTMGTLVKSALQADADPLDAVRGSAGSYVLRPDLLPPTFVLGYFPAMGSVGAPLTLTGGSIDQSPTITFPPNQVATVQSYTPYQAVFVVPPGAVTGEVSIMVGTKVATAPFQVIPAITGTATQ